MEGVPTKILGRATLMHKIAIIKLSYNRYTPKFTAVNIQSFLWLKVVGDT